MTDNFNYQDVFKTNIPELDQNVSLHAKYLLGAAQNNDPEDSIINKYRRSYIDTPEVTQAIWELRELGEEDNDAEDELGEEERGKRENAKKRKRPERILAVTVMGSYFRIGIDRQPSAEHPDPIRWSVDGNWATGPIPHIEPLASTEVEEESFYDIFYDTVAALGLKDHLVRAFGTQKESSEAIFANAA